ncbi:hypothetical protein AC579_3316 [Pseudocercospora musae]|uniref:Enhancer of mRNA-decapping protein 3 n=1 Tax=Pseudocercospora musae TaxID=113226 RepID=A0A139H5M4_9PEZI|nr:hypothetical protein AC579_3316 [Pseudocercospora musae]
MGDVVGSTVWIKLKNSQIVYGVLQSIVAGSHLTLQNVYFPNSGTRWESWTVQATAIEDLEVTQPSAIPQQAPPPPQQIQPPFAQAPILQNTFRQNPPPVAELPEAPQPSSKATFVDPAIVSYRSASPVQQKRRPSKPSELETPVKAMLARAAANLPSPSSPFIADLAKANAAQKPAVAAVGSGLPGASPVVAEDVVSQENGAKKKVRRGQKAKKQTAGTPASEFVDPPPVMNSEVSRNGNDMNGAVKRGKGWRSTPLLQPSPATVNPLDQAITKKSRRNQKEEQAQEFAHGDTTDIHDMGDFDFDANLKKFDKKQVFDEIRAGDTTADEDRLVSHNRLARPGTYGGKNLHPTENVLSPNVPDGKYNSQELDSSSDADTELNFANGRSSSKHSVNRTVFPKTRPSRQNSGHIEARPQPPTHTSAAPHSLAASMSSDRARNRSTTSLTTRAKQPTSLTTSSPRPDGRNSPLSAVSASRAAQLEQRSEPHFAIATSMTPCPTLLPRALENLEAAAVSAFGITHDSVTENAARCIAEAALQLSDLHGNVRRPSRTNTLRGSMTGSTTLPSPTEGATVVVLAGNHDIGARALAAARQLLGRNINVIAVESLFETADSQDPQMKIQSAILRRMARRSGSVSKLKRGIWSKSYRHIKNLTGPPAVIIDALLAGATYESLLAPNAEFSANAQKETREMIDWANRSRAPVLSIGCPSGLSGVDGISTIVEGEPLSIRPDRLLALGAPFQGLLKAVENGELDKVDISVADIGINIALKSDEAVAFGTSWVADLQYQLEG